MEDEVKDAEVNETEVKTEESTEQSEKKWSCCTKKCTMTTKKKYIIGVIILLLAVAFAVYSKNGNSLKNLFSKNITKEEAKTKFEDFVKKNVPDGTQYEISDATEENGLYKMTITVSGQAMETYMTKDGSKLFPQAIDLAEASAASGDDQAAQTDDNKEIPRSDKPEVKLFVMSYCPYGTQIEKGILPVLKTLGTKINFSLEFVNYSMHGDKEITENLVQYCIEKNEPAKLNNYLSCFLKKGEGTTNACMQTALVNVDNVTKCVADTDSQFNIKADAADKSKWSGGTYPPFNVNTDDNTKYDVQGSPTLIINGVEAKSSGRDSASLLSTICGAFKNQPAECKSKLSSSAPAPGFGDAAAASGSANSNASCGN